MGEYFSNKRTEITGILLVSEIDYESYIEYTFFVINQSIFIPQMILACHNENSNS
mgnify:CR=1 FL=1